MGFNLSRLAGLKLGYNSNFYLKKESKLRSMRKNMMIINLFFRFQLTIIKIENVRKDSGAGTWFTLHLR